MRTQVSNELQIVDRWIDEKEASRITGMSRPWFQRKRWEGGGPRYTKLSRACRYRLSDVLEWMDARATTSTSQPTGASPTRTTMTRVPTRKEVQ